MKVDYSCYLVLDDVLCPPEKMVSLVGLLLDCGVTCIQLRMKQSSIVTITSVSKAILALLKSTQIPLIINDHVEIAAKVNADGVHIGQKDMPYSKVRDYLGYSKIIGLSIENIEQAKQCCHYDVDYFGVGPIFPTATKLDAASSIGIQQLNQITHLLSKPVVAIGGINEKNLRMVLESGVSGVAFVSAVLSALHPELETKKLSQLIQLYRGENAND